MIDLVDYSTYGSLMSDCPRCQVFLGSSNEGKSFAEALQAELAPYCEVVRWDQGVFEPGGYTLDSLIATARETDFAVLIATPDDARVSRGETANVPRDNVILEFGLFAGLLGRERTFMLATNGTKLPTDILGQTRLTFQEQKNERSAVSTAATEVRKAIDNLGSRDVVVAVPSNERAAERLLDNEVEMLIRNAEAQGWSAKTTQTAIRLTSPKRRTHTLTKSAAHITREDLRTFAKELRADGLRISTAVRRPVNESPLI